MLRISNERRTHWAALLFAALLLAAACSSDDRKPADKPREDGGAAKDSGTAAPTTDEAKFLADYAEAVCEMYEPCCESYELGYDRSGCSAWLRKVTKVYFAGMYRAELADSCLAELAAARENDPQRCANELSFDRASMRTQCRQTFARAAREGKALGEDCLLVADCASSEEGAIMCHGGRCVLQRDGSDGDGPCIIRRNESGELPTQVVRCDAEDGLFCHEADNVCRPQVEDGESCSVSNACKSTARCIGGRCVALPGPGESCVNAIAGAGGFCRPGNACDIATLVCGPPLPEGGPCREPEQCESRSCMGGKCTKPEFTRALNCTGD